MSVEFITYRNKKYPVKLGYYALKHTSNSLGVDEQGKKKELKLEELTSGNLEILETLLYYSLKMGAHLENETLDLKEAEMDFVMDSCLEEFVELIPKFLTPVQTGAEKKKGEKAGKK